MNKLLAKFRLSVQISVIGAIGIIGLIAIGAVYLQAAATQSNFNQIRARAIQAEDLVSDLRMTMLQARRHEKDFQLRRNAEFQKEHTAAMAHIVDRLAAL